MVRKDLTDISAGDVRWCNFYAEQFWRCSCATQLFLCYVHTWEDSETCVRAKIDAQMFTAALVTIARKYR
jgi:hypothetical protein